MEATELINGVVGLAARCETLARALERQTENSIDVSKFYAVTLSTEEVAKLHGVSAGRVRDYAQRGLIPLHPNSTDAKFLFRASEALRFNFSELKKAKAQLKR